MGSPEGDDSGGTRILPDASPCTCGFTAIRQLIERVDILYLRIKMIIGEGRQQLQTCGILLEPRRVLAHALYALCAVGRHY